MSNLSMPPEPRYQPKELIHLFGYDNLAKSKVEVELALLATLADYEVFPSELIKLITPEVQDSLYGITESEIVELEKTTGHDVQALIIAMCKRIPDEAAALRNFIHFVATSFDIRDNALILLMLRSYATVVRPALMELISILATQAIMYMNTPMIGRTHLQHAIPITAGFWMATILQRIMHCTQRLDVLAHALRGKFSGAVGACNAQVLFGLAHRGTAPSFEDHVLRKLGLVAAPISTQILPPEPLAEFLHEYVMLSAALAQLGDDVRHLHQTEVSEVIEGFGAMQTGSSTMSHKRNPIKAEQLVGMYKLVKAQYQNVLSNMTSNLQRDLRGSCIIRQYPAVVVLTFQQVQTAIKLVSKWGVDVNAMAQNLKLKRHIIMSEALQLALRKAGFSGEAHDYVNHKIVPLATPSKPLLTVAHELAKDDTELARALDNITISELDAIEQPETYIGLAAEKTEEIVMLARSLQATPFVGIV